MTLAVIVTGPPASGKTTIAERLADEFALPLFTKDGIKETLFDSLGIGDRGWSQKLGVASFALLWHVLERELAAARPAIVEGNFSADHDAGEIERLQASYSLDLLQIHCHAPVEVLLERYASRARHPGHLDDERLADIEGRLDPSLYLLPRAGATVGVDTTAPAAYELASAALARRVPRTGPS